MARLTPIMSLIGVYQCDICSNGKSLKLIQLVDQEKLVAVKLIKSRHNCILPLDEPTYACVSCFKKLYIFRVCLQRIIIRRLNGKMHQPGRLLKKDDAEEETHVEGVKTEEDNAHDYTCQCQDCQNKYGSLPLLVQVIEQKSRLEKTENPSEFDPQPSTSSSQDADSTAPKKVLKCQYCDKNFTHKGDYNKHLRKHTKEQPFSCQICKRKFAHTSNLQRHYRLHSGQRPFVCNYCDKSFSRKDKLECHTRSKFCKRHGGQKK
ncbi:hypothetical protein NQ318_000391 [Aromia moschata]|uniref:C2H2-type domain-containing protein n=1 Tax=Aromia moschata TaxID=1265417 RepID=A0AAV8YV23_9CUCU|nr:hypothetical protein NQ318_000391 [Aromia moschata]